MKTGVEVVGAGVVGALVAVPISTQALPDNSYPELHGATQTAVPVVAQAAPVAAVPCEQVHWFRSHVFVALKV